MCCGKINRAVKPVIGMVPVPRVNTELPLPIIITLPPTRHYHATPTHAILQIATQYQITSMGRNLAKNGLPLSRLTNHSFGAEKS